MAQKVVGKDVSVFSVQASGQDGSPSTGAVASFLGRWESVEVTLTNEWSTVTSSDGTEPEKRWKGETFTGSLKTWIDSSGSQQLLLFGQAQLVVIVFTERNSGRTITIRAGISKTHAMYNMDHGKDDLEFEDVGNVNFGGLPTFAYA